jgi:hypothetical protein
MRCLLTTKGRMESGQLDAASILDVAARGAYVGKERSSLLPGPGVGA